MKARKFAWPFAVTAMVAAGAFFIGCSNGSTSEDETVAIQSTNTGAVTVTSSTTIDAASHQHTFAATWSSDVTGHWYAATCDHTTEKKNFAAHTSSGSATRESAEVCTVCGYEIAPRIYLGSKKPAQEKAVGDIVFNDGSATPYSAGLTLTDDQKNAAIAIIFYVGSRLNSDAPDRTPDNVTIRTLGVGLKHNQTGLKWCTPDANASFYGTGRISCIPSGEWSALTLDAFDGSGDKNGSDNFETVASFLGINNDTEVEAKYPAFYFAKNYKDTATNLTASYEAGWYLPSFAEFYAIELNRAMVDAASALCGGSQFGTFHGYLTSSSCSDDTVITSARVAKSMGYAAGSVCAIREFN
ncbi:MAG: hypothetical protein MJZ50_05370 [Treponema sp.]|nr:hypothetical protein [Treponema sp.]